MATSSPPPDDHNSTDSGEPIRFEISFNSWLIQQQQDLDELLHASATLRDNPNTSSARTLTTTSSTDNSDSVESPSFMCPAWCASLENSLLWIGGCRPSFAIRFVYSLTGLEFESRLEGYLKGERKGDLSEITLSQLTFIDDLHANIVKEERD